MIWDKSFCSLQKGWRITKHSGGLRFVHENDGILLYNQ